ncbi:MAG: hypothetical protein HDS73_02385 [Bacteroidales bacterium]|nr:hypothetical protein [Bacteroidales bacterium]
MMKKFIIALALLAGMGSMSVASVGEAPRRKVAKAKTAAPRKKAAVRTSAISSTPKGIIGYLDKWDYIEVKNLNQLTAEIAKANRLAPTVIKSFDTRNPAKTGLSDVEKVAAYGDYLSSYISNSAQYNENTMSMAWGVSLQWKYYEFAATYIYGKIAAKMESDEARAACYNAILGEESFYNFSSALLANLGSLDSYGGSFIAVSYPHQLLSYRKDWINMLVAQYQMLSGQAAGDGKADLLSAWFKIEKQAKKEIAESSEWLPADALADMGLSDVSGSFREGAARGEAALKACGKWLNVIGKSELSSAFEKAADTMLKGWLKTMAGD